MKNFLFITIISLLFLSCSKDRIEGNGDIITETRSPGNFHTVLVTGSRRVEINYGDEYKVELRGSSNLISRFRTRVSGSRLKLEYENRLNVSHDDIRVYITVPKIREAELSGSGKINIYGNFPVQDEFRAYISGSGDIKVHDGFAVEQTTVGISGSGEADLENLDCRNADVNISGSGDVRIGVEEKLKVNISGSGKVYYHGNASVESRISGSGKVIKD